jgi:WD40 repeat protein
VCSGKFLVSGSENSVKFWDLEKGLEIASVDYGNVNSLAFSPDGKFLAIGGANSLSLWHVVNLLAPDLDSLLLYGCQWLYNYLQINPNVSNEDRTLCDDILQK